MMCKTRHARLRRSVQAVAEWCRGHRHLPVKAQHAALTRRIQGHFNYFGVSGNFRSLLMLVEETRRAWYKWLRRRSQQAHLTWERCGELLKRFPLPRPRIMVRIWGTEPRAISTEEPDGGNLLVRFRRGPRGSDPPGLLYNGVRKSGEIWLVLPVARIRPMRRAYTYIARGF